MSGFETRSTESMVHGISRQIGNEIPEAINHDRLFQVKCTSIADMKTGINTRFMPIEARTLDCWGIGLRIFISPSLRKD